MAALLILEDDAAFASLLKRSLTNAGHVVTLCESANSAMQHLSKSPCDIVISDLFIHKGDALRPHGGFNLIARVRDCPETKMLPIIAMTGAHRLPGMQHILSTAKQFGANANLKKPFHMDELLTLIDRFTLRNPNEKRRAAFL